MKKLFYVLIVFVGILCSCGEKVNYSLQYEVIKSEADPKDLWLFSNRNYLLGIDPVTFEEKLVVEFNYYISNPLYIDGKIYMSEEQHIVSHPKSTHYGNQILCLNDDLTFNSEIQVFARPNDLSHCGDYLVASSAAYFRDEEAEDIITSGFSIVDLKTNECVYENKKLSDWICNTDGSWSYKNRLFLGTYPGAFNDIFRVSVFNLDTMEFEAFNSRIFSSHPDEEKLKNEYAFVTLNDNQLWITYYFYHTICVYDLDTYDPENQTCERIAKIDLKKDYNILQLANEPDLDDTEYDGDYRIHNGQFVNGKYHVVLAPERKDLLTETSFNGLLVINTTTFELEEAIEIDHENFLVGVDEIRYSETDEDVLILRQYDNQIVTYDINTGAVLEEKTVCEK